ncbi:uncharacterized protein LOC113305820 [Papaver somniferum]|uniref:uncharacterized protein LOC113305820 n=1 Tax=Papaver somniferum TaxID=3469 RepID=UPI000E7041EF|nr:uncharacterized protein LOC113305820 [Papaver somniferum]
MNSGRYNALSQIEQKEEDELSVDEKIIVEIEPHMLIQMAEVTELEKSEVKFVDAGSGKVTTEPVQFNSWTSVVNSSGKKKTENSVNSRRFLWSEMQLISDLKKPWLIVGDFNAILRMEEKVGGNSPSRRSILDFSECIDTCQLIQAPKVGLDFSWSNCKHGSKRILCNLDRAFFNMGWLQMYGDWGYKVGIRVVSYNSHLMRGCENVPRPKNVPLRFQKMWLEHPDFMKMVEDSLAEPRGKLKRLKTAVNEWNWKVFGNVQVKIKEAENLVKEKMLVSDSNPHDDNALCELVMAQNELNSGEVQHSIMMKKKSRIQWKRFQFQEVNINESLLDVIPQLVTEEDQNILDIVPNAYEIKKSIWK